MIEVVDRLDAAGICYCIEGGWGVDVLLETQTRHHDDLDFAIPLEDVDRLCATFAELERDDAEWPATVWLLSSCRTRSLRGQALSPPSVAHARQARPSRRLP